MLTDSWGIQLVRQISLTGQYSEEILEAFERIPREIFSEYSYPKEVIYSDDVIITSKNGYDHSTSSQPSLMALFMKTVGLSKQMRVLEIGSGTGYNACVMSQVVGENGLVVGIEVNRKFFEHALKASKSLGIKNVLFINQDGAIGYEALAPYDAVVVTVAVDKISMEWLRQLKIGGRIIVPLNIFVTGSQPAVLFEKLSESITAREIIETRFLTAKGTLGNLNEENVLRLKKIQPRDFAGVLRLQHCFEDEMFRILHMTSWSLCKKDEQIYYVQDSGYAVWQGKWELFGSVEKLPRLLEQWERAGFAGLRNLQITYDKDMNFLKMELIHRGGMGYV